jgi:NAD+ kinase
VPKRINNVTIILKPSKFDDSVTIISNIIRWLHRRKRTIIFHEKEFSRLNKILKPNVMKLVTFEDPNYIYKKSELIVSLGGDGTLLGVCRKAKSTIPIFGVNLGRLGFIAEFSKTDFYENLTEVIEGKYAQDKKPIFSVTVKSQGKNTKESSYYFNDVVFNKHDIARMFTLAVYANNDHIYNLSGDGLIISSTTGSTAYSLAAGGPIVHPDVKAMILTPICPHGLTHRPIVIPDNYELIIKFPEPVEEITMTLDGQNMIAVGRKDTIIIKKESRKNISLIKNPDRDYFHTLKEKFVHGRREL